MKRKFAYILFLLLFVVGCTSESEREKEKLISSKEGKFTIVTFHNKPVSGIFQETIGKIVSDKESIESVSYFILGENSNHKNYEKIFNVKKYPHIIVFDNKGIMFETNELEELENFLK